MSETAQEQVDGLLRLMTLERLEVDLFRGPRTEEVWRRVYGGQVVAQALMAACHTIEDRMPHSLHAYFMRPGNPSLPIVYQVLRDRDGGSFSSRRVVAIQDGQKLLNMACSFHKAEPGLHHAVPMPPTQGPEDLPDFRAILARFADTLPAERQNFLDIGRPIEFRPVDGWDRFPPERRDGPERYWFRAVAPLPDHPVLHRVLLAYASDMVPLNATLRPHGVHFLHDPIQEASLDHAVWLHDDVRLDDWLLYVQESPWAGAARGFSRGMIFQRDGRLVASVAQEGLIRMLKR